MNLEQLGDGFVSVDPFDRVPEQIRDGLTVIGMGVELPGGFRAEAGCLIGPGASPSDLRRRKVLRRGQSVPEDAA